jgi:uncharacterized membrane protein
METAGSNRAGDISSSRLEAFSDGVIAIIITIMVLELKIPHEQSFAALLAQWPVFISYILSFLLVAVYWLNHHMLFHLVRRVDNRILWSNMLLLFTISLIPFFTGFMAENRISAFTISVYSAWCLVCATAFLVLLAAIFRHVDMEKADRRCLRRAALVKCTVAQGFYLLAAFAAFASPLAALALNFIVAAMYFLPDAWLQKKGN